MANGMRFQRLGGACQLEISRAKDLYYVLDLNDAHWAMTSVQVQAVLCDHDFLSFLDSDGNGRIRVDEVRRALRWMLSLLSDLSGVNDGSDVLDLSAINENSPEGAEIARTVRIALDNLKIPSAGAISLAQISNQNKIIANALQNGDGIIPPEPVSDPLAAVCVRDVMTLVGKQHDRSGVEGIGEAELKKFEDLAAGYLAWLDEAVAKADVVRPFGAKTDALHGQFRGIADKVDDFFKSCEACAFTRDAVNPRFAFVNTLDPLDAATVNAFWEKAPIADVNPEAVLDLGSLRNPLWRDRVAGFFRAYGEELAPISRLTAAEWQSVKNKLTPFGVWLAKKNTALFDAFEVAKLREFRTQGVYSLLRNLMRKDVEVDKNLTLCTTVRNLILCQKYMLEFLNNFVNMDRLFDNALPSMIQAGRLVMDGRCFSLCTGVFNIAEHKKIASASNICVMYLDAVSGAGPAKKTMKIAAAVTSGNMWNLFVGKSGVFFTRDGEVWDAKVIDFIQQPVSIPEAVKMPFYKFGDFLQKQADKFFTARSKQYEDSVAKGIQAQTAAIPAPGAAPVSTQPPAVSGSMMLMGGGVGIAAIGSGFAFMAKSLQGVSVGAVLAMLFGILFVFGAPFVIVSLVKLFRRNLSIFLEANGYAMNGQMRLSLKMGRFFTFTPKLPKRANVFVRELFHVPESLESDAVKNRRRRALYLLVILLTLEILVLCWIRRMDIVSFWVQMF